MAALAADRNLVDQEGKLLAHPVNSGSTIFKGSLCKQNAAGFLAPCASEAGSQFAGVAIESSTDAINAGQVRVQKEGAFELPIVAATQANVGDKVYAVDDNTVTVTSAASLQVVGYIEKYISATKVLVQLTVNQGVGV